MIDRSTATLTQGATGTLHPVRVDGSGAGGDELVIEMAPALVVDPAAVALVVVDWRHAAGNGPPGALTFDGDEYVLDGRPRAVARSHSTLPVAIQNAVGRVVAVAGSGLWYSPDTRSSGLTWIDTAAMPALITEPRGALLAVSDLRPGDLIRVRGTMDDRADLLATAVTRVTPPLR